MYILNQIYSIFFDFDNDEVFDCEGCINDINNRFSNRNLYSIILASDGLYNDGINLFY